MKPVVSPSSESNDAKNWDCVHQCPQCGHITKIGELDLKAATSGIAACPNCTWKGQIEIQIVERSQPAPELSAKEKPQVVDCAIELEVFTVKGIATKNGKT